MYVTHKLRRMAELDQKNIDDQGTYRPSGKAHKNEILLLKLESKPSNPNLLGCLFYQKTITYNSMGSISTKLTCNL